MSRKRKRIPIIEMCAHDHSVVIEELEARRYLLPAGNYGGRWQRQLYYIALWFRLKCVVCGAEGQNFVVQRWGPRYSYPIGPMGDKGDAIRAAIRAAILKQMEKEKP